jgi:hypothetical protein
MYVIREKMNVRWVGFHPLQLLDCHNYILLRHLVVKTLGSINMLFDTSVN